MHTWQVIAYKVPEQHGHIFLVTLFGGSQSNSHTMFFWRYTQGLGGDEFTLEPGVIAQPPSNGKQLL